MVDKSAVGVFDLLSLSMWMVITFATAVISRYVHLMVHAGCSLTLMRTTLELLGICVIFFRTFLYGL